MTMMTRFTFCTVVAMATLCTAVGGHAAAPEDTALQEPRAIIDTLLGDEAEALWPRMAKPLQAVIGSPQGLSTVVQGVHRQFGTRQQMLDEQLTAQAAGYHYRQTARFDQEAVLEIDLYVDGSGLIHGLQLSPASRFEPGPAPRVERGRLADDDRIRALMDAFVEASGTPGLVVGVLDAGGRRFHAVGDTGHGRAPDVDTLFEAGSITKGLTGLLFAQMLDSGEVDAEQTIGSLLPDADGLDPALAATTLHALSTHRSGLPALGPAMATRAASSPADPYAGTSVAELFAEVAGLDPAAVRAAQGQFEYSNLGMALLGQLLARAAGEPFEAALEQRVFTPLGLAAPLLSPGSRPRSAQGHHQGSAVPDWQLDAYAPAGAWRASAKDMLDLAEALLEGRRNWVNQALARQTRGQEPDMGLGWFHGEIGDRELVWHNGGTGGFRSFMGIVPDESLAVVVLANDVAWVDALALALLDPGR